MYDFQNFKESLESLHLKFEKICKIVLVKSCNSRLKSFVLVKFERKKERKKVLLKLLLLSKN